jgi:hypothetical protein
MFIAAALSWAGYSVLLKGRRTAGLPVSALFAVVALSGALLLAPFALWEFLAGAMMPQSWSAWGGIAGIVVFSSLLAFSGYQYGVARLGRLDRQHLHVSVAGLRRGAGGAGSRRAVSRYHAIGILTVLTGLVLATAPPGADQNAGRLLADPAKRGKRLEQPVGHRRHSAGQEQDAGEHQQCAGDLFDGAQMLRNFCVNRMKRSKTAPQSRTEPPGRVNRQPAASRRH